MIRRHSWFPKLAGGSSTSDSGRMGGGTNRGGGTVIGLDSTLVQGNSTSLCKEQRGSLYTSANGSPATHSTSGGGDTSNSSNVGTNASSGTTIIIANNLHNNLNSHVHANNTNLMLNALKHPPIPIPLVQNHHGHVGIASQTGHHARINSHNIITQQGTH